MAPQELGRTLLNERPATMRVKKDRGISKTKAKQGDTHEICCFEVSLLSASLISGSP